jgi:hypothetical protein
METLITFGNKLYVNYDAFETRAHDEQDKDLFTQSCKDNFDNNVWRGPGLALALSKENLPSRVLPNVTIPIAINQTESDCRDAHKTRYSRQSHHIATASTHIQNFPLCALLRFHLLHSKP